MTPSAYDIRRISVVACVLLVTLRLFIGWQFLYEGLWKWNTRGTANEWSAEGYLKTAHGPFRDHFRGMTGDPDDLSWLDYEQVAANWDRYADRLTNHFGLSEAQQAELRQLIDGADSFTAPLRTMPDGVTWATEKSPTGMARQIQAILKWDRKQLVNDGSTPLKPSEIQWLKDQVPLTRRADGRYARLSDPADPESEVTVNADAEAVGAPAEEVAYFKAIERLEALINRNLGYKRRAKASLQGDPDRIGVTAEYVSDRKRFEPEMTTTRREQESAERDSIVYGEIQVYKDLIQEYRDTLEGPSLEYREDHSAKILQKLNEKKAEVVGPIQAMDDELRAAAAKLLTAEQMASGALPPLKTPLWAASMQAMVALIILGALLLLGLCTRVAAIGGAVMLTMFYLVWPPWPGVPAPPGPDHSFIVNKNLIEVVALLAIAALPTGSWFGVDGIFSRLFHRWRAKRAA